MDNKKFTENEIILLLSHHPKIGGQTIKKIRRLGKGDLRQIYFLRQERLREFCGEKISQYIEETKSFSLFEIENTLKRHQIGYVTYLDKEYPKLLLEAKDHPAIIFVKGDIAVLNNITISVVGSRKYSNYGARICAKFCRQFAMSGLTVISGMALGIDSIAHNSTLEADGMTLAVLGCGLDRIYPTSNKSLADKIISNNGAIISEYVPGTEPFKSNFPARNRIIAALSKAVLVIEAAKESGALITALLAIDYNREVYAVPGPIDSESSAGCNWLISQGAMVADSVENVLNGLDIKALKIQQKAQNHIKSSLEEDKILNIFTSEGLSCDEICRASNINVATVTHVLTMLEMKGILENVGGIWRKK